MTAVMQPTGREVSCEGYDDVSRSGRASRQQEAVLNDVATHGPSTRHAIAERVDLPVSTICGRCKELLDAGELEVVGTVGKPARQVLGARAGRAELTEIHKGGAHV
ncbi:hypothetical protein SAMN05216571_101386 [Onishia taeanensis]|uniref:Winged helix-turn-helix DNA-binding n=1 Tax=Onishia taeanensis TaxID=284577 RepID=A0A1G7NE99_9GAMM|nr:helix-turn-helix domain-containing protein [Halomonas taeanensis]SDF72237.1 hypothetical protein SAMN05216571_101386 [Halomonas taeanensis]